MDLGDKDPFDIFFKVGKVHFLCQKVFLFGNSARFFDICGARTFLSGQMQTAYFMGEQECSELTEREQRTPRE